MNCAECTEQLVPHLEGLLAQSQQRQLESHLDDCPTCRAELDRMRRLFDRLVRRGKAAPSVSPEWLTGQLLAEQTSKRRRNIMRRTVKAAVAAVLLISVFLGIAQLYGGGNGTAALVQAAEQLRQARTVAWTEVFYANVTSKDEKTTWVETTRRKFIWKAPGRQRTTHLDAQGRVYRIEIEDHTKGVRLVLDPGKKKARLTYPGVPLERTGQFASDFVTAMSQWLTEAENGWTMGEPKPLGKKNIDGRETTGYRVGGELVYGYQTRPDGRTVPWSADLWVDAKTKQLVLVHNPGVDVYDPEKDPARHNRPGEGRSITWAMGSVYHDIVSDEELDDSLFSLDPPSGYDVTEVGTPKPTENDMVEWLGIRAQCNGDVFPDDPGPLSNEAIERIADKYCREGKISPAEKREFERRADGYCPVLRFVAVTAGESWHYAGKGVKLGDNTAIVCWYKPSESKSYRVLYGDLSVKNVAPEDLPSQVAP
jgi:hypothetical protein